MLVWPHTLLGAVALLALSHALILYPTLRPNVQWLGPVITRFATDTNEVWLTIDDGPSDDTPALLALLARYDAKATFFVKGDLVETSPDHVRAIIAAAHTLANHSQTHPAGSFWCSLPGRIAAEIDGCNRALHAATGTASRWFRAPVGMKNPAVHPALAKRGMRLIGWTARGFDAVVGDPELVYSRIVPLLAPGAIIVLHQGRSHSLRVIERVLVGLRERGYRCIIPEDAQLRAGGK